MNARAPRIAAGVCALALGAAVNAVEIPSSTRSVAAARAVAPTLEAMFAASGVSADAKVLVRIFKLEGELELWAQSASGYVLLRTYPICHYSGELGPKLREGDGQAPEGIYTVGPSQLNPQSRFHLAFNLGYPNAFDRSLDRTGNYLMVHGNCVSIGCYAMGDVAIEEIYSVVARALAAGQRSVPVHAFPFRFPAGWRQTYASSEWLDFWSQLEAVHQAFEHDRQLPRVLVRDSRYVLESGATTSGAGE